MSRSKLFAAAILASAAFTASSQAGLTVSTTAAGPFPAGAVLAVPPSGDPTATPSSNQQAGPGVSQTQTFRTGATGFTLDRIAIYSGGKAGADFRLNIYPEPVGGAESDGYVNTSFSTDLLGGGNGLTGTVFGSAGTQVIIFDLTGADEITLAPNTKYALEFDVLGTGAAGAGSQFSWQRSAAGPGEYADGNIYQAASEQAFAGTAPANGRGERYQVGGTPNRDGFFALYSTQAIPEPTSIAALGLGGVALLKRRRRGA